MPNTDHSDFTHTHQNSTRLEEKDLWDLDEEREGAADELTSDPQAEPSELPEQHAPLDSTRAGIKGSADHVATSDAIPAPHQANEASKKIEEVTSAGLSISKGLSLLEKATLATLAIALLGLAIYSYTWLYKKNLTSEEAALNLPIKGDYITISDFSTYWVDGTDKNTEILPVANITLDPEANSTGALRIYFSNTENRIMGDPITLSISKGKIIDTRSHNITVKDDGYTVEIISSEGFDQEADFNAYVLDNHMAWSVSVFEADQTSASGREFEEHKIIHINIDAKRK